MGVAAVPRELKLVLPDEVAALLGPEPSLGALARVAGMLYAQGETSFGAAARLAGVPYQGFFSVLARYGISLNYAAEDLAEDLKTLGELFGRRGPGVWHRRTRVRPQEPLTRTPAAIPGREAEVAVRVQTRDFRAEEELAALMRRQGKGGPR